MAVDLNPPLRLGQILQPRNPSLYSICRIVKFVSSGKEMLWTLRPIKDNGETIEMTLSDIYANFKFPN